MAYNNGFPMNYPYLQMANPYLQQPVQPAPQQQAMTPPTIHAEILQVEDEAAASRYPVAAGASQMMMARDDSAIFVKTAYANGQGAELVVYTRRPPAPPKPAFDPEVYVTRDELEERLQALMKRGKEKKEWASSTSSAEEDSASRR